jgi:SAM-dependent methyltransferase
MGAEMTRLNERKNLLGSTREHWKPPSYAAANGARAALRARLLRFLDLQAATIWEDLANELPLVSGTVVDVGCGVQPYRQLFSDRVRYIGIDSADTLATFRVEAPDTVYYSGDRWPLESGLADFVLCTETLEHVAEPDVFLSEMHRVLKPGGRAILTVPFAARWHFIPHDYWRPTPSGLDNVLRKAGFTNIGVYGRGNQLTVACYKGMGFVFSLLAPQPSHAAFEWLCRAVGALSVPPMLALAVLANATRGWPGTVDFLGFTVSAEKPT